MPSTEVQTNAKPSKLSKISKPSKLTEKQPEPSALSLLPFRVDHSSIHGTGVFATRTIRKGARVIEYVGERISHEEAERRYEDKSLDDNHTFLFTVDHSTVIDAGVGGNAARFINHSCAPNCEAILDDDRIFIEAIRSIALGEELVYDYQISRTPDDPANIDEIFVCRCGAPECRGTMMAPKKKPRSSAKKKANGNRKPTPAKSKQNGAKTKMKSRPRAKA